MINRLNKLLFYIVIFITFLPKNGYVNTIPSTDLIYDSFQSELTHEEKEWLVDHKIITLGANPEWHPIEFKQNNIYQGIAADYIRLIEKILGIRIEVIMDFPWKIMLSKAQNKEIDGITCIAKNEKRKQEFLFTRPYYACPYALITHKNNNTIHEFKSITNQRIAIEKGFYLDDYLQKKYPTIQKYYTKSTLDAIQAVADQTADAYIGNLLVINYYLKFNHFNQIKIVQLSPFPETPLQIAIRNDWPELIEMINKAILLIPQDYHAKINTRWNEYLHKKLVLPAQYSQWLNQHPIIKLGNDPHRFPIDFFNKNHEFSGIAADYLQLISEKLGVAITPLKSISWKESIAMGEQGLVDMFACMSITSQRKELYLFSKPYIVFPTVIFLHENAQFISNLKDLNYKRIAIVEERHILEQIQVDYPLISIQLVENLMDGINLLINQQVDALIDNIASVTFYCAKEGITQIKAGAVTPYQFEARFAVRKDWPEWVNILDLYIDNMSESEKYAIHHKWFKFEQDIIIYWNELWQILIYSLAVIIMILGFILFWNRRLRVEISLRKKVELNLTNSESQLSQIINFLPYPTWVINNAGHVVAWNLAIEKLTGLPSSKIVGQGNYAYAFPFYNENRPMLIDYVNQWRNEYETYYSSIRFEGKIIVTEAYYQNILGGRYLSESASPLYNLSDEIVGAIESIHDITEQKKSGEMLLKAKLEAEEANKAKSSFLATMSHEIRTPMNSIIGMTHLVLSTQLKDKQLYYVKTIQNSANLLLRIINDILDFSKIESGKIEIEEIPFNLKNVMNEVYESICPSLLSKQLDYQFEMAEHTPISLLGDPLRIKQILLNLLTNAIKFTNKGFVRVAIDWSNESKPETIQLKFAIQDTGIGLTKDQINKLFVPFTQADSSTTRKYGGSGLGLAICKTLTELMGGNISVMSEPNVGTTFVFTIQCQHTHTHTQEYETIQERQPKNMPFNDIRAMIVDDNEASRLTLKEYLNSFIFEVTIVSSGKEALSLIMNKDQKPFHLILLDWNMPDLDGIETARKIKQFYMDQQMIDQLPRMILITAYGNSDIVRQAKDIGLNGFIEKPISRSLLFNNILNSFGHQHLSKLYDIFNQTNHVHNDQTILIVEDNEINQEIVKELLENKGFSVIIANNGKEAIDQLNDHHVDLILMDIQMPEMDGFETTQLIKSNDKYKHLPIIAMTAHAFQKDRKKCLEIGMNDFVSKPIHPNNLYLTVYKWLPSLNLLNDIHPPNTDTADDDLPDIFDNWPALPGINVKLGISRIDGNQDLYRNLLIKFYKNHYHDSTIIHNELASGNVKNAQLMIHSIKSIAGNIGAMNLYHIAQDFEISLRKQENTDILNHHMNKFTQEMTIVCNAIETLQKMTNYNNIHVTDSLNGDHSLNLDHITSILNQLNQSLKEFNMDAIDYLIQLKPVLHHPQFDNLMQQLENSIRKYDFDTCSHTVQKIGKELGIELT